MNNAEKAKIVFAEELELISSETIRRFVLECFEKLTPDYFWDGPASSCGKHHPEISNKKHGLVLHVKLVCWWAKKLEETMSDENCSRDVIVAACLLHDLQKFGTTVLENGTPTLPNYSSTHGVLLALQLEDVLAKFVLDTEEYSRYDQSLRTIISAVALHMGRWTELRISQKWKESREVNITHLADYCASRKVDDKIDELDKWEFPNLEK